jgi:hypothetical protein
VLPTTPLRLRLGHQPAEVPGRPDIPSRLRLRQQPLRRNPPQRLLHPHHHQVPHLVKVSTPGLPGQAPTGLVRLNDPAHRLMRRAADLRGTSIAAHIPIGGNHIHPIPRVLHNGDPFRGSSDWLTPSPSTAEGPQRLRHDQQGVGTFTGHQRGPPPGHQWGLSHGHGQSERRCSRSPSKLEEVYADVINGWRTFSSSTAGQAALVRAPRDPPGGPARRAARRIDRLPPPTCLGLITCSDDRLHSPYAQPSAQLSQSGSASVDPSYNRLDRRTPTRFQDPLCHTPDALWKSPGLV